MNSINYQYKRTDDPHKIIFSELTSLNNDPSNIHEVSVSLRHNASLTKTEQRLTGYARMDGRPRVLKSINREDFLYRHFPKDVLSNIGIVEDLKKVRKQFQIHGYTEKGKIFSTDAYLDRTNARIIPGADLMVERLSRIGVQIIESCLTKKAQQMFHERAISKSSLCVGNEENRYLSTIRITPINSFSNINTNTNIHRVHDDDPCLFTIRINLGLDEEGRFSGRICLPTFKEYCDTEPFTALVFKRTLPFFEIQGTEPIHDGNIRGVFNVNPIEQGFIIEMSPHRRLMNSSYELGYPRSMSHPLIVFGTFQNYSEWLFRLAIIESIGRESRGNFVPIDITLETIAHMCGYQIGTTTFLPRLSLATTILQYPDRSLEEWNTFSQSIKELHRMTNYRTIDVEDPKSLSLDPQPISWIPDLLSTSSNSRGDRSLDQSTQGPDKSPLSRNAMNEVGSGAMQARSLQKSSRQPASNSTRTIDRLVHSEKLALNGAREGLNIAASSQKLPQSSSQSISAEVHSSARQLVPSAHNDNLAERNERMTDSISLSISTSHPYNGFTFKPPEWNPPNGLTAVLNKQIMKLFDIEKLREATGATCHQTIQPTTNDADLKEQLSIHIQVLDENHSVFNDYFHLVSRSAICSIIQQAPQLKKEVYDQIAKSDGRQRLRFGISTKAMEVDTFWKDFSDRNALVCEMSLHIGTHILLAPGFYSLILTAGGNSPGSNSAVRSPLQPAMRYKIVEACLWHSKRHPVYMGELKSFWMSSFTKFHSHINDEAKILKLPQHIPDIIPSIGSCFPQAFNILHEIISHIFDTLKSGKRNEDFIWGRTYETDRLGCLREAGDSLRSLSKAKLDRRDNKSMNAEVVFRNILCIRTLFFGNIKKLRRWKRFIHPEEIENLILTSLPFEEFYRQSRIYNQFQFPVTFLEFQARIKSCWNVTWPLPITSNIPDWSQVHSVASNTDFAGGMIRSLVANDMSRFGWCMNPTSGDWSLLLNPSSFWSALNELFPDVERTHGPGQRFVDPSLAKIVTVSISTSLESEVKEFIGFDHIFVEHLLG